jgi:serine/threonine protein kinase
VLEYLPTNLAQVIEKSSEKSLEEAEIKSWMLQILVGVVAYHKVSILHRDLKPSNMLVVIDGFFKIVDLASPKGQCWFSSEQKYYVPTTSRAISVVVCGDLDKLALLTYPDAGLNHET